MRVITTVIVCLFLCIRLFSQNTGAEIKGTVYDVATGESLEDVEIIIKNTPYTTSTNDNGIFIFKNIPNGNYTLELSILEYSNKSVEIRIKNSETIKLDISMKKGSYSLQEISLQAKSKARQIREEAMPITVISMSQLQGTVTSVSDVLLKTVGVTIRNSGGVGASSRLSVRGLEGKRIGFFIDEVPLNDQSDFIDLNDIPTDMIDRIEIYKGVVPAKFGGSAMGGAVNIVIKEYPDKYADFSYSLESFNTHKIQTVLKRNNKNKGITYGFGGIYTYSDNNYEMTPHNLNNANFRVERDHDMFRKILIAGNVTAKKWWFDEVIIEPVYIDTYREIQGIEIDIRHAHVESQAYVVSNALKKENFLINGLELDMSSTIAQTHFSMIDTARVWYDWYGNSYPTISKYGGELGNGYPSNSENSKLYFTNKLNLLYLINEQHAINYNSYLTLAKGNPKDDLRKLSIGTETLFDKHMKSLVAGLTYDFRTKDDKFLNSLTTRYYYYQMDTKVAGIYSLFDISDISLSKSDWGLSNASRYKFTADFIGKFAIGYELRIPSESELLGDGYTIIPSGKLQPERNTNLNLGVLYDLTGKARSNLQLELNSFYMHLNDMIRYTSSFVGAQYQNFGEMRSIGIEFDAKADILPYLYAYGNITYQDLRDARAYRVNSTVDNPTKDKRMPNIPYLLANAGVEFHKENLFGGKGQNTRIFADYSFIEEYLYDFEMTQNQRKIPRSHVFDLGFEHSFFNRHLFVSGKIKNITDETIVSEFNRPLPGRSYGVKIRYLISSDK